MRTKPVVDKKAVALAEAIEQAVERFQAHVGTRQQSIRTQHARTLATLAAQLRRDEQAGWIDL